MVEIFQIIGIIGLISIIIGLFLRKKSQELRQYIFFAIGGIGLLIYSIDIKNTIFIILQAVYTIVAIYEIIIITKK